MDGVCARYTKNGIILKPVDLGDLVLYDFYDRVTRNADGWGMKPGGLVMAKACTRMLQPTGKEYLQQWLAYQTVDDAGHSLPFCSDRYFSCVPGAIKVVV